MAARSGRGCRRGGARLRCRSWIAALGIVSGRRNFGTRTLGRGWIITGSLGGRLISGGDGLALSRGRVRRPRIVLSSRRWVESGLLWAPRGIRLRGQAFGSERGRHMVRGLDYVVLGW